MLVYIVKRLLWALLLLFGLTVFTFVLIHLVPGNPAIVLAGIGAKQSQIHALYVQLGLNKPLTVQYEQYLLGLAHLNLGRSAVTGDPVTQDLANYLPPTIELLAISFVIYTVLSIAMGVWAAHRARGVSEMFVRIAAIAGSGMPVFWVGAMLQVIFFGQLHILPNSGQLAISANGPPHTTGIFIIDSIVAGQWATLWQTILHLILPVTTIVLAMLAAGFRSTRASVLQELERPYVRTAEAKGLTYGRVLGLHVLKNALNPVVSILSVQLGYLLGWVALVETVFQWPGVGLYFFKALQALDYAPIMALTLIIGAVFVVVNLIADLLYPFLDPRLRDVQQ